MKRTTKQSRLKFRLEFPQIRHCGIPSLRGFEKRGSNLIKSPSLRGFEKAEAISFKKFRYSHLLSLEILNEIASSFVSLTPHNDENLEFLKHRHCEGAKRPKQSHQIAVIASEAKQSHWGIVIAREQSDRSNLIY